MSTALKEARLAVRLSTEQDALIRHAAEAEGMTVTEFTVAATVTHARDALADRRLFVPDDASWTEFLGALDAPVRHRPQLEKLFAGESIFE